MSLVLARPPGGPRKIFNSNRGPQPKKFGNRWSKSCYRESTIAKLQICANYNKSYCYYYSGNAATKLQNSFGHILGLPYLLGHILSYILGHILPYFLDIKL